MPAVKDQLQMFVRELKQNKSGLKHLRKVTQDLEGCVDLQIFWNMSPDMFSVSTTEGKFIAINDSWINVLGWSKEELLSKTWFEFIHPNDIRSTREVVGHLMTNNLIRFHNRYRTKTGDYVCLEWSATKWCEDKCYAVARPIPTSCTNCPEATSRFGFEVEPYVSRRE
jgi:PAS domain S-box-containing protein